MKEFEKLAMEASLSTKWDEDYFGTEPEIYALGYEAGFLKAREWAADIVKDEGPEDSIRRLGEAEVTPQKE